MKPVGILGGKHSGIHSGFDRQIFEGGPLDPGASVEADGREFKDMLEGEVDVTGFPSGSAVDKDFLISEDSGVGKDLFEILSLFPDFHLIPLQGCLPEEVSGSRDMASPNLLAFLSGILLRRPGIHNHSIFC